jgi:hypothetical protein
MTKWHIDRRQPTAHADGVRKGTQTAGHIIVDDHDDRPERMIRDPDRYFAEARMRAEQEVRHRSDRWLLASTRRKRH